MAFITNGREIGFLIKEAAANVNLKEAEIDRERQDNVFGTHTSLQTTVVLYETLLMVPTQTGFQSGNTQTGISVTF